MTLPEPQYATTDISTFLQRFAEYAPMTFGMREVEPARFIYMSPGFSAMFGYPPGAEQDLSRIGALMAARIHPDDIAHVAAEIVRPISAGAEIDVEYRILRASDNKVRNIRTRIFPVPPAEEGGVPLVGALTEDVTELRDATAQVQAARAIAASHQAERDELFSRTSHELRTPLNAVLGFAQLLELELEAGPQLDAVHQILDGGRQLLAMVNDILNIAQIDGAATSAPPVPIAVGPAVDEALAMVTPMANELGIDLRYPSTGVDREHEVLAGPRRLTQVLVNVLTNAVRYNRTGGWVEVQAQPVPGPGAVDIIVRDSGIGIAAENLPRVFTPFDRLGQERGAIKGTGIGMAVTRQLLASMSGRIDIASTVGVGSVVTITLPSAQSESLDQLDVAFPTRTLLLADDSAAHLTVLSTAVERHPSWRLIHTLDPATTVELARMLQPSLVILDLSSPEETTQTLRQLRSDATTAELPVVRLDGGTRNGGDDGDDDGRDDDGGRDSDHGIGGAGEAPAASSAWIAPRIAEISALLRHYEAL